MTTGTEARKKLARKMRQYIEQELMLPASRPASIESALSEARGVGAVTLAMPHSADAKLEAQRIAALQEVAADCAACTACALSASRTRVVPGAGSSLARLMLIGEGPGQAEDAQGTPFVGRCGQLLTKMLVAIDISREHVFITNIVKCRPPENRVPQPEEVAACLGYLERQIAIVKPELIVALGATAAGVLLNEADRAPISKIRGRMFAWRGIPLMPTYHPAYLLRANAAKKEAWKDMKQVLKFLSTSKRDSPQNHA